MGCEELGNDARVDGGGTSVASEYVSVFGVWSKIYLSVNFDIALTRMLAAAVGENEMKLFQLNTHTHEHTLPHINTDMLTWYHE